MAGWGGAFTRRSRNFGRLLTYTIGGSAKPLERTAARRVTAIPSHATPAQVASGAKLFETYCVRCHSNATVLPDLRRSAPTVLQGLEKVLVNGALADRGMPAFDYLDKNAIAELRAYLLDERRKIAGQ